MSLNIQKNSIFIADSHYNEQRADLFSLLKKIQLKKIETTQLFLMGDIFDFICCESNFFVKKNKEVIDILNELSKQIEIIFLEGNHDFNLKKLFPNIKVYSRSEQPAFAKMGNKSVALTHGDLFINSSYDFYCAVIRNNYFLSFLNLIDINNWLTKKINKHLLSKNICHIIDDFEDLVKKRILNFKEDVIIEGHYHQGKQFIFDKKEYINIPSLACGGEYGVFLNNKIVKKSVY